MSFHKQQDSILQTRLELYMKTDCIHHYGLSFQATTSNHQHECTVTVLVTIADKTKDDGENTQFTCFINVFFSTPLDIIHSGGNANTASIRLPTGHNHSGPYLTPSLEFLHCDNSILHTLQYHHHNHMNCHRNNDSVDLED